MPESFLKRNFTFVFSQVVAFIFAVASFSYISGAQIAGIGSALDKQAESSSSVSARVSSVEDRLSDWSTLRYRVDLLEKNLERQQELVIRMKEIVGRLEIILDRSE